MIDTALELTGALTWIVAAGYLATRLTRTRPAWWLRAQRSRRRHRPWPG